MANVAICRVCLCHNSKMCSMQNTGLEKTFQLITSINLNKSDNRPKTLCYICFSQLQKCCKFRDMSRASEKRLTQFFRKGYPLTTDTVTMLNEKDTSILLSLTKIQHTSLDESEIDESVIVKEEPEYSIDIEEETFIDDIKTEELETTTTQIQSQSILDAFEASSIAIPSPFTTNHEADNHGNLIEITDNSSYPYEQFAESKSILEMYLKEETVSSIFEEITLEASPAANYYTNEDNEDKKGGITNNSSFLYKGFEDSKSDEAQNQSTNEDNKEKNDGITNYSSYLYEEFADSKNDVAQNQSQSILKKYLTGKQNRNKNQGTTKKKTIANPNTNNDQTKKTVDKRYPCDLCSKSFTHICHLERHKKTHERAKDNACKICGKVFYGLHMIKHMESHNNDKVICDQCNKTYKNKDTLRNHKKMHNTNLQYICDVCKKVFSRKYVLIVHMRLHVGGKPHACDKCEKKFTMITYLKNHKSRVHSVGKPYACKICEKTFSVSKYLNRHMITHSGDKPYSCSLCDKKFAYYTNMKLHILTHTGETPFSCDICDKKFTQQTSVTQHIKMVHLGVRPYSCEVCAKTYSRKKALKVHMRIHTIRPYSCEICSKSFDLPKLFKQHLKLHSKTVKS